MSASVIMVVIVAVVILLNIQLGTRASQGLLPSAVSGLLSLGAVGLVSLWGPSLLSPNPFTVGVACFLGIPGVVGLLLLRLMTML
ncbi:MAG: hypothetical protein RR135_05315 [Oscillospiraceae bacterium]